MNSVTKTITKHPNKTLAVYLLEQKFGKPIQEILVELFEKHGSQTAIAEAIGVTQGTVSIWFKRYGVQLETTRRVKVTPATPQPPSPALPQSNRLRGRDRLAVRECG